MSSSTRVDGLVLPKQVAGHPALELVNTRAGWDEPYSPDQEYLRTPDHLIVLAAATGLLDPGRARRLRRRALREGEAAEEELDRARRVRRDLHDVLAGSASRAAEVRLATAVTEARRRQSLVVEDGSARWGFPAVATPTEPLDALLVRAGDLLVDGVRVDACPGHACGWMFVNPAGRRRWCQMAVCGNRAKQAAHAARAGTRRRP